MAVDLLAGHIISELEEGNILPTPSKVEDIDAEKYHSTAIEGNTLTQTKQKAF